MKTKQWWSGLALVCAMVLLSGSANALTLDLTSGGSGWLGGGFFSWTPLQPVGSGALDPFVRINPGGNQTPEEGYNATARPVMPDVNTSRSFTHDVLLSAIPLKTIGGESYYEFILDINQTRTASLLSLDRLEFWVKSGALTQADTYGELAAQGASKVWSMDDLWASGTPEDSEILLDYLLGSGSGAGDMYAYIPVSLFGSDESKNLYLFSHFGDKSGYEANDGYEEWGHGQRLPVPDSVATVMLLGGALMVVSWLQRRCA